MFGEEARVTSVVILCIHSLRQTPLAYHFARYKQLSLAYVAALEATGIHGAVAS